MKNRIMWILLAFVSFFGFNKVVDAEAVPNTITTGPLYTITEYVPGLKGYAKPLPNYTGYVYCETAGLKYSSNTVMKLVGEVNEGFSYIISHKPSTGDANKDYYVTQIAVWWYKDILNGTDSNISTYYKNYITNHYASDQTCKLILDLVNGAKSFKQGKGSIEFSNNNVNFTLVNGNYISDRISITSTKMDSVKSIEFVNAPSNTIIINSNVSNGNGTFQISVPQSSVLEGTSVNFSLKVAGTYGIKRNYEYFYSSSFQKVINDKIFSTNYDTTEVKNVGLTRNAENRNELIISKVDENGNYVKNATLTLYEGDCTNRTCYNRYSSWVTDNEPRVFTSIEQGVYTLVEENTPAGYRTASKMLVYVTSDTDVFKYKMVDYHDITVKITKTDVTGTNAVSGATLVLKNDAGIITSWVSTNESKTLTLNPGVYYLTETNAPAGYKLNNKTITFKVLDDGSIMVLDANNNYIKATEIKMVNEKISETSVNIAKLDKETNNFVEGAVLAVKNNKGETITSWTTTNDSHYISLGVGEYSLVEVSSPNGYIHNTSPVNFKVTEDGKILVQNDSNEYTEASGIIFYNTKEVEIVEVPKTGLSSTLTYIVGSLVLAVGATVLVKNGKEN